MTGEPNTIERLKQAIQAHRKALEALEDALLAQLEALAQQNDAGHELLSLSEVRQELRMSKGWVYQRIRSGEIPHVKLGHNIKVKREDLDAYLLEAQHRKSINE